ncbi:MAG: TonB-dependent receptor plug domain-containing protein [Niabella sp.]
MKRLFFQCLLLVSINVICIKTAIASVVGISNGLDLVHNPIIFNCSIVKDTIPEKEDTVITEDTTIYYDIDPTVLKFKSDTVNISLIQTVPYVTLQQMLKGTVSGVYVQETTGEPGSVHQNMYIRGVNRPLLNQKELYLSQPAVYVNGIPIIQDNPYTYNIQTYDVNPLGSSTNLLSVFDQEDIEEISIIKDFKDIGLLGPRASNGAVYITTKNAKPGKKLLSINGYYGYALSPKVNTINAATEKNFRLPFYNTYGTAVNRELLPDYLSDSSNTDYYGPSNWTDLYYKNTPVYNINASLTGGAERSSFRAFFGTTQNGSPADATNIKKYKGSFYISMIPAKWMTVSSMISGTILDRSRNRLFTDRFAEMRYLPSIANPLPPNKGIYQQFIDVYEDDLIDDNLNSIIQGYFSVSTKIGKLLNTARLSFDYNENKRDVFYPKVLFSGNNYVSNYYGFNQRFILEDNLAYSHHFNNTSVLDLHAGVNYQGDISRYSYLVGYNGPDDVKRIAEVQGSTSSASYLIHNGYLVSGFLDKVQQRLMSFWGSARYKYNRLEMGLILRSDGNSSMQPSKRWLFSPVVDAKYKVVNSATSFISAMDVHASWGRIGDLVSDQLIGVGPQYSPQLSWGGFQVVGYNGYATYSRPYNQAWIGYDIPWSYVQQLNIGTEVAMLKNQISVRLDVYNKDNKNLTLTVPTTAESGYLYELKSGMWVRNRGVDLTLTANIIPATKNNIGWTASLNSTYNENELMELPGSLNSIILNNRKLEVGHAVDEFWLLQNKGVYTNASQIPSGLTYKGLPINVGDPIWSDVDGNNVINDHDKVLHGTAIPKIFGGLINQVTFKKFDFNFHFQYALGHHVLNGEASNYMDFITRDNSNSIDAIKEITYWEDRIETGQYPMYNPWSPVRGYQPDQDLFLEKANYLSMRSATLGYKITGKNQIGFGEAKGIRDLYIYITGTNLFKISPYTNRDPELANYLGYDNGLSLPLTRSVILGLKLNL